MKKDTSHGKEYDKKYTEAIEEADLVNRPPRPWVFGEIEYKAIKSTLGMDGTKEENDKKKQ